MIGAGLRGLEPGYRVTPGQHVLLDAELGNKEAVDDVLGRHDQFHIAPDGNVQRVNFALAFSMVEVPHPLRCEPVDFSGGASWRALLEIDYSSPGKYDHEDAERNDRPG